MEVGPGGLESSDSVPGDRGNNLAERPRMNRSQQGQKVGEGLSRPREQHLKGIDLASWGTESLGFSLTRAIEGVRGML